MIVRGEGPVPAHLMLVGEAPGKDEHFKGRPFVGKSGKVLTSYLRRLGISREDCYVTNLVKEWPGEGNPDPTPEAIKKWWPHLLEEIGRVRPKQIIALGRIAAWHLLDDGTEYPMDWMNGVRIRNVVPVYHPAAGLYEPSLAARCFWGLKQALNGAGATWKAASSGSYVLSASNTSAPEDWFAVDTEGSAVKPWGLSWSTGNDRAFVTVAMMVAVRKSPKLWVFHNALHDLPVLRAMGVKAGRFEDTMVLAYLLQTEPQGLKALAFRHLGKVRQSYMQVVGPHYKKVALSYLQKVERRPWPEPEERPVPDPKTGKLRLYKPQGMDKRLRSLYTSLEKDPAFDIERWWGDLLPELREPVEKALGPIPTPSLDMVPIAKAVHYAGADAADTAGIYPILWKKVKALGLEKVARIDMAVLPIADQMQTRGIRLDLRRLAKVNDHLLAEQGRLTVILKRMAGKAFNPASGDQVAAYVFAPGRYAPDRMTRKRTRPTTDDKALEALRGRAKLEGVDPGMDTFIAALLDHREVTKLITTYISTLSLCMASDGRIHPRIHPTRVVTGRWSMSEPNLQNIPVRGDLGKSIRSCFIPERGNLLVSVDLSQIELRMMAHESEDAAMCGVYQRGEDIHETTRLGLGIGERIPAKTVNFGVMYGISPQALLEQLHRMGIWKYGLSDCEKFIARWFATYPGVRPYLDGVYAEARRFGFVRDFCGRLRWVPNVYVDDPGLRAAAEREAGNFPIQAGATEVGKIGMAALKLDKDVWPLLWIHDELILEVPAKKAEKVGKYVQETLSTAVRLRVPVEASMKVADNWSELK